MNRQIRHPLLASSAFIGKLQLKNKIVMAPMGSNFAGEDGHTTEQLESYYEERAKGGVGLIILETSAITWPAGASMPKSSSAWCKNRGSIESQRKNCSGRYHCWKAYPGSINTKISTKRYVWFVNSR